MCNAAALRAGSAYSGTASSTSSWEGEQVVLGRSKKSSRGHYWLLRHQRSLQQSQSQQTRTREPHLVRSQTAGSVLESSSPSLQYSRGIRQMQLDCRIDILAVVTAVGERSLVAVGLKSGEVEIYRLLCPKGCDAALPADAAAEDDATLRSPPEQLVEVSIVRSASVAAAASAVDVSGSRCSSDLTSRVLLGGSHLLVWSFLGAGRPAASLSLIPLPPCLYTAKALSLRQAALSPDGAQLLVAGSRGVALFALLQRRWRLLCSERQEAQLPTGLLPLGWYTNDIFFATTSASIPLGGAPPAAAAAPEPRSLLGATDASPRWLLPLHIHRGVEAAVAAAVESCPISSSRLGASFSSGTTARETRIGSGTHNMRHYAMCFYAGDASKPVLAVFDALRLLTAYQLQPPCHERRRHQQYDVAALWQLDLSDFCDRPPQQIRFGVTGLWSGAEAQMREHYVLPSAHVRVLRSRKLQEERDTGCRRELLPACCCCTCTAPVGLSSQPPGPSEHGEQELQQPAVVTAAFGSSGEKGISVLRDNRSGLHGAGVAHIPAERASGAKNTSSRESSNPFSRSSSGGDDATEGGLANFPFRWSAPGDGLCGKRLSSAHGASNSNFFRNADSIDTSKKVSEELEDSAAATGQQLRRRWQTFWAAGRSRLSRQPEKQRSSATSLEAYTRGACCTLPSPPADYGGGTAAVAAAPTLSSQAEPGGRTLERRTSVTEAPLFRSECHSSAGVPESSAPPFNDPMVSAQPREARTDGLMLTSVTFHYSGTSTAALANHTPEQLVEATDVRLRSALVLLVEKRPQPLHILGIIGEVRTECVSLPLYPRMIHRHPCCNRLLNTPSFVDFLQCAAACVSYALYTEHQRSYFPETSLCRLLESISDLVDEFQSSPLAPHLLELCQVGLLMRCISTYSKAGKAHRMQLRAQETTEQQPEIHSPPASASTSSPSVLHASTLEKSTGNERVVAAAAAALMKSPEGIALLWLLRTLQQQSPQLFLATVVSCMRKTEPLVSPAVLGSLLQQQLPPADPVALFTKSLNSGLLHTASLYLLPIQATEGPLEVRCRRVLPLLRAALAVGDFHLVRKLLHFFWAFFTHRRHPEPVGTLRSIGDQHHWESSALKSASDMASQRAPKAERAISQQKAKQQRRLQERNRQREELQSLLWRPLNGGVHLSGDATFAHPAVNEGNGLFAMTLGEPCLSCVPLELAAEDRLLAARIYQEVENAVAVAAQTLFRQQQWLRLFEFATILALDLPSWLRDHRSSTLWHPTRPPHQQDTNARLVCVTAVPDTASPTRAAKEAAGVLPRDFFAAVSSFAQQFPVGEKPIFLHLHRPRRQKSSTLRVQRQAQQHPQVHVARMPTEAAPVPEMQSAVVPVSTVLQAHSFCTSGNMQYHSAAQIARYLGNVLLLAGHPMYALALAAAVRDMQAATHLLGWFPEMRYWVSEAATGRALDGSSEDRVMLWLSRAATSGTSPLEYRNAN
ncbi:hypothetical protein cyc_07368 [Cyclospora cayetanensis]|uniref:RIC1 C-terminal alpha solenoid region domain-containing protein n=1 Tax=Cyclospora cayetanensis TaxID=88456 RepID=A0A1D3D2R2_9EIME|nr:hypothetical protein cyc_07368 [Cyclospora cayetanensis]